MKSQTVFSMFVVALFAIGCGDSTQPSATSTDQDQSPTIDGSKYVLTEEPEDAATVIEAREQTQDGDDVVLLGRIGGSSDPWIEGRAAFSIVDPTLKACSDIPGDECEKPWDYCCETNRLPASTAFVRFVDQDGKPVKTDARKLLAVRELQTVIVRGKAERDDAGNLTVLASAIFIRPGTTAPPEQADE